MTRRTVRCFLSLALTAGLLTSGLPATLAATPQHGELSGRVVDADGVTPRPGVVVHLYDAGTGRDFASSPTRRDGAFTIAQAPAGTYDLVVEGEAGAFMAGSPLELAPGQNDPLALRLNRGAAPSYQATQGTGFGAGSLSPMVKWIIVGTIAVASALVVNEVTEDEDEDVASPSF